MAVNITHVVQQGENLQLIATQKLGDTSRWYEIATLNNLVYPYIVSSNQDKMANPLHLVCVGDKIKLPEYNTLADLGEDDFGEINRLSGEDSVYDNVLGMDIKMDLSDNLSGRNDQKAWLDQDSQGHMVLGRVIGIDNLKQSLCLRLLTDYGSLPFHPNYGSHLVDMIGKPLNADMVSLLQIEILRVIKTDSRVASANIEAFDVPDGHSFFCLVTVTPTNEQDAFKLFIQREKTGSLAVG